METNHWQAPGKDLLAQLDAAYVRWHALSERVMLLEGPSPEKLEQLQQEMEWLKVRQQMHHTRSSAHHVRHILANMLKGEAWVQAELERLQSSSPPDGA